MNGDKLTRWTAVGAVLAVAAVAGWVPYWHCTGLVSAHGEPGITGHLYAATIDGLIIAASMVLLDAARHEDDAPRLAWWMLAAGIGGTFAVNVLAGLSSGWLGAVIAGWPAAAFVASYELLMLLVRAAARRAPTSGSRMAPAQSDAGIGTATAGFADAPGAPEPVTDMAPVRAQLNGHAAKAERMFAVDITEGRVPGIRRIMTGLHVGDERARLVQQHLRSLAEGP